MTDLLIPRPTLLRPSGNPLDPPYTRQTVTAAAVAESTGGGTWRSYLTFEGLRTTEMFSREINGLNMRPVPLPFMALDHTTRGHQEARICGRIEKIDRLDSGVIYGEGTYARTPWAQEVEGLVGDQVLRWVSVDLEILRWEWVFDGYDDDGWEKYLLRVTEANIMGATIVPFPAFSRAVVVNGDADLPAAADQASTAGVPLGQSYPRPLAVAASAGDLPPAELFADPHFDRITHTGIRDVPGTNWRHFAGHLADWKIPHIGIRDRGQPVYAPRSMADYAYFRTGTTATAGGAVRTGVLSLGGGHADISLGYRPTIEHYDDVSFGAADLAVGEDQFGPWVSGVLRPETTFEQARVINSSDVSGDWRRIAGNLELVAILCVNVAGFPVADTIAAAANLTDYRPAEFRVACARDAEGEPEVLALVAAGLIRNDPVGNALHQLRREITELRAVVDPLRGLALERLAGRVHGG